MAPIVEKAGTPIIGLDVWVSPRGSAGTECSEAQCGAVLRHVMGVWRLRAGAGLAKTLTVASLALDGYQVQVKPGLL